MGWVLLFPLYYFFLKKKIQFYKRLRVCGILKNFTIVQRIRDVIFDGVEKWKYMTQLLYFAPDLEV